MSLRAFTPSHRAPWRVLLRLRSVREGALRRARILVYRIPVRLPQLSRLLRLRQLMLPPVRLLPAKPVRMPNLMRVLRLPALLPLPARRLACRPRPT